MTHPISKNNTLYFESVNAYPNDHRGVKWSSHYSQFIRFKVICDIAPEVFESRILDVGCGLGHLVDYLISQGFNGHYKGIDLVSQMISGAHKRHPTFDFETNDIDSVSFDSYDFVLASGIFPFVDWEYTQDTIRALFARALKGVAFNCLSALEKPYKREAGLTYYSPIEVFNFCQTITPKLTLRHDYLTNDFTIYLYK